MSRRPAAGPALALGLGVLLALVVLELGARLLEPGGPMRALISSSGERVEDPVLGYRTLPFTGENDAAGYRNAERLARADVVALGDSQTWGTNAERDESWPARLADLTGLSVYNMGRGGYCAVQYLYQLDEALELSARWIVVAIYLGNDIYDAYSIVYSHDAHERLRNPDESLRTHIVSSAHPDMLAMFFERARWVAGSPAAAGDESGAGGWLANSAFVRAVARLRAGAADGAPDRAWAAAHPQDGFVYDDGRVQTVFHTSYRLGAVDSSLPKVREGLRITLAVLDEMAQKTRAAGDARLLLVLLPSKERVFAGAVAAGGVSGEPPESHRRRVREEQRIAARLAQRAQRLGVDSLDLLPALEQAVARGEAIFPANADGHFMPAGYEEIARAVAGALGDVRVE